MPNPIPFNKPIIAGQELTYIEDAVKRGHLSGDGYYSKLCEQWLEKRVGSVKALMTHSCTGALEMAALLANLGEGDEVIMPSFTFVSTANAFVLRGSVPVFVDIDPHHLCLDTDQVRQAITPRTKAICVVHYAGISCEMDKIMEIAAEHNLVVIEDAAQSLLSEYKGRPLGSFGHFAALSFHETKNVFAGEGGALLINNPQFVERAEIIREKGTNRKQFFRGFVDKYTWVDVGSSYLPSELVSAFLFAQLEKADEITTERLRIWNQYAEKLNLPPNVLKPVVPPSNKQNGHIFHLRFPSISEREDFIQDMKEFHISCVFHYIPLHSAPAGQRFGRAAGALQNTLITSQGLVRLPLWNGLAPELDRIINAANECLQKRYPISLKHTVHTHSEKGIGVI